MYLIQMNIDNKRGSCGFISKLPNEILYRISDFIHYDEAVKRSSARKDAEDFIQRELSRGPNRTFPNQEQYIQSVVDRTMTIPNYSTNENINSVDIRRELNKLGDKFVNNVRG